MSLRGQLNIELFTAQSRKKVILKLFDILDTGNLELAATIILNTAVASP